MPVSEHLCMHFTRPAGDDLRQTVDGDAPGRLGGTVDVTAVLDSGDDVPSGPRLLPEDPLDRSQERHGFLVFVGHVLPPAGRGVEGAGDAGDAQDAAHGTY